MRRILTTLLFVSIIAGCAEFESLTLHPVTGKVTRQGQPVKDGGLIFIPTQAGKKVFTANASVTGGTFEARTDRTSASGKTKIENGIPAGTYKAIYHPASNGSKSGLEVELQTFEVKPGGNEVDFELPEKMPTGKGAPRDDDPSHKADSKQGTTD